MPELNIRSTTKLKLPSSKPNDEAWVEIYETSLAGNVIDLGKHKDNPTEATYISLLNIIKSWNFTINKEPAPVTIENIKLMDINDVIFIVKKSTAFETKEELEPKKKDS